LTRLASQQARFELVVVALDLRALRAIEALALDERVHDRIAGQAAGRAET
jgi:hypothetical protein